jgi:hypothetical protein
MEQENYLISLIEQTYITPSSNQTEILAQWKTMEKSPEIYNLLAKIIINSTYDQIIRVSALLVLKNLIESTQFIPESLLQLIFSLLFNDKQPIRKAASSVIPTAIKLLSNSQPLLEEMYKAMEAYITIPEVIITGCNVIDDFIELNKESYVLKLLEVVYMIIVDYEKVPLVVLSKVLDTYGNYVFNSYPASIFNLLPPLCKITVQCTDGNVVKSCYSILSNIYDKDKYILLKLFPNFIKDVVIYNMKKDYNCQLSVCEFLLHILEEGTSIDPSWLAQLENNLQM